MIIIFHDSFNFYQLEFLAKNTRPHQPATYNILFTLSLFIQERANGVYPPLSVPRVSIVVVY